MPGVVTNTWLGLFAPAGTPRPIVDRLNKAMVAALKLPDVVAKFKLQGLTPRSSTPEELDALAKAEFEMWGRIIPAIGIQPE